MFSSTTQTDSRRHSASLERESTSESRTSLDAKLVGSSAASPEDASIVPLTEAPWHYKALVLAYTLLLPSFFIDAFGTAWGSVVITVVILIGSVLISASTHFESFALMVVGRILFGLGSGVIVSMQEAVLSHWFRTKSLAVVIGVQLSVSRLASFFGTLVVVPLVQATGFYGWAFWLSSIICFTSVLANIAYTLLLMHLNGHVTTIQSTKRKKIFRWRDTLFFPSNFWLFGRSNLIAAYYSSVLQVVPIVVAPFLGILFDRVGKRMTILTVSAILLLVSMALLSFTYIHPMVGMFFFSISLAFGPLPMLSSIPIVNPIDYVGTSLGIYKAVSNIGSTILDILVGVIQDATPGQNYDIVMPFLTALSAVAVLVAAAVWAVDRWVHRGILEMNMERRRPIMRAKEREEQQNREEGTMERVWSRWNYLYGGMLLVSLMAVWGLYFVFALSGSVAKG
ncbi:major facilitator superfamily domain-containing protein [Endogone sp. FLAS-F59071]|nr:major facilitator superfamily domain-containing protein [Endogone sp. FLAS-F59071]|eukprot:RUS22710.1 major facilitator superfamily domain-containing protein [Endogone sp. FLAS-F59071]